MPAKIRLTSVLGAALLALAALPAAAHDRTEPADAETVGSTAKLHTLVLYTDARLAFYGSDEPRPGGCRERVNDNSQTNAEAAPRAEK